MSAAFKKTLGVLSAVVLLATAGFFTLDRLLAQGHATSGRVASFLHLDRDAISVSDQAPSEQIRIEAAALKAPGFVVVYDDEEGPGKAMGVSRRLSRGVTRGLEVALPQPPIAGYYYAMLRRDDGDGKFDPDKDPPERDASGAIVMARFLASTGE